MERNENIIYFKRLNQHGAAFHKIQKMSDKKISSALISVYSKDNLDEIVRILDELGVKIYLNGRDLTAHPRSE